MEPVNALGAVLECLGEILRNVGASAEAAASAAEEGKPALAIEINGEIVPGANPAPVSRMFRRPL